MKQDLISLFAWMSAINLGFFFIGLLKITIFKNLTMNITRAMFGSHFDSLMVSAPRVLIQYYILILIFNVVPYLVLRFTI